MRDTASRLRLCGAVGALATCVALGGCAGTATAQATPQRHTAAPTQTQPTQTQTPPGAHLVVVGDSLAVGVDQERPEPAWPLQLARALGDRRPSVYGMPGFTAGQLDVALDASGIRDGAASVLVVEAGTNDLIMSTPLAQFRADYPRLLDDTTANGGGAGSQTRLICLGVWHREVDANNLGTTGADYDATIQQACEARGGAYVPLSGLFGDPANISPTDHFHPSSAGQQAIADLIEPYAER